MVKGGLRMNKDCIEIKLDWEYDADDGILLADVFKTYLEDDDELIGRVHIYKYTTNPEVNIFTLCGKNMIRNAVLCNHRSIIDALIKEMDEVDALNADDNNKLKIDNRYNTTNVMVEINLKEAIEELKKEL